MGNWHWRIFGASFVMAGWLAACSSGSVPTSLGQLNSRYADEQPALSGDGHFVAFVSNRDGSRGIQLYDLRRNQLVPLPGVNRRDAIAESPSLSYTGRYLVYLASDSARPEIEFYDRVTQQVQVLSIGYRGWIRHPSISPDGRYVVFESGNRGQWDIELFDRGPGVELDLPDFQRRPPTPASP